MNAETFLEQFAHLAEAPNGIPKLRALILQLAVRGKLVPQDPNDEPASELLKKIHAERQRLITNGLIRKPKPLPAPATTEKTFGVPSSWAWTLIGYLADVVRGVSYRKHEASDQPSEGMVPILRAHNISEGSLNTGKLVYVPVVKVSQTQMIQANDMVIATSSGSASLVGKAAQATQAMDAAFGAFCAVARFTPGLHPDYQNVFFQSPEYREGVTQSSRGIGINNLRVSDLLEAPMPIPPLAEQKRIVAKVDELMALCDQLEAKQQAVRTKQIALNRASLHALTDPTGQSNAAAWHRIRTAPNHPPTRRHGAASKPTRGGDRRMCRRAARGIRSFPERLRVQEQLVCKRWSSPSQERKRRTLGGELG